MKKNSLAVAIVAVAFLFPVQSFADTAKVGDVTWGFRTDKRLNDMTNLFEPKQIGILDKNTGITHITTITKVACVLDKCLYRTEYQGTKGKKQEMQVFDIEDVLPKNSGNKKISMGDKDVAENAKKLGIEKEKLKKALEDENEYQKLLREIQVKKEQQRRKEEEEKEKNKNSGTGGGGGGGGSSGGGGMNGKNDYNQIYAIYDQSGAIISDNPSSVCQKYFSGQTNKWGESIQGIKFVKDYSYEGHCKGYFNHDAWGGANKDWVSVTVRIEKMKKSDYNSGGECQENGVRQIQTAEGKFSVICTYKHKPKQESSTVGSTGSSSSTNNQNGDTSSPNGSSAGGGGGGGRSGADHATTPDSGKQGGGNNGGSGKDGTTGGSGQDGTSGSGGQGGTSGSGGQSGTSGSGGQGGTSGSGGGGGGQDSELPDVPDSPFGNGDGEPDWGGLKSNGDFGSFRPSSAFSTGGACPQDITLDFGQFGTHQLPMSYVCMAVEKLRYVFIFMAYFFSAMMVFKTVNSMKG